ncbi:CapA family protein [Mesorhizobium sp. CAU 1741]|uniref:CapA family protein n=1 Tax=Mesorhizobium sp. CAU 1741 TaxID=3140366 RepID=UPI00325B21FE
MTTVLAVGDVAARRVAPDTIFDGSRALLSSDAITFGQLESVITDGGAMSPNARLAMRTGTDFAPALARAGFDVMSFAGNHCLDWGYEGFSDTLAAMAGVSIPLCGAGETIAEARKPAIVERDGTRFAFLGYNSILPEGYAADVRRAGCAPLRALTTYRQIEPDQPGTGARVLSFCDPDDLAAMVGDIQTARQHADVVIVSMHWGIHMTEAVIAHYQREAARAAIEAGAAAIVGHHAHILKGVEFHRGAPIFCSLGNFAIEQPHIFDPSIVETESFRHLASLNPDFDPAATYMLPPDTRLTGIARLEFDGSTLTGVAFHPALIDDHSTPHLLDAGDPAFDAVQSYLARVSDAAGFSTHLAKAHGLLTIEST